MKTEVRPLWKDVLAAIWLGMVIPGIILHICVLLDRKFPEIQQEIVAVTEPEVRQITLLRTNAGRRDVLNIDEYLTGVLLAEMPASFEEDALKAQTVAARTFTLKSCLTGGKHGTGSLCDDSGCCQGFLSEQDYLSRGGTQESLEKVRGAVADTDTLVLEYGGELIEAVYFSSSGGKTESALAVWGGDFPYLQSVESPQEEASAYLNKVQSLTIHDFQSLLNIELAGPREEWFADVKYTDGGGVESMTICGTEFTGVQIRSLLTLPSTMFSIVPAENDIIIITNGYGHRVGLSQYGANSMAKRGRTFSEILAYYYPGTSLVSRE